MHIHTTYKYNPYLSYSHIIPIHRDSCIPMWRPVWKSLQIATVFISLTVSVMLFLIFPCSCEAAYWTLQGEENTQMLLQRTFLSSGKAVVSVRDWSGFYCTSKQPLSDVPCQRVIFSVIPALCLTTSHFQKGNSELKLLKTHWNYWSLFSTS